MSDSAGLESATASEASSFTGPRPPGVPRWVKALILVGVALLVLVAVMLLSGGGHGPGRHSPSALPSAQPGASRVGAVL